MIPEHEGRIKLPEFGQLGIDSLQNRIQINLGPTSDGEGIGHLKDGGGNERPLKVNRLSLLLVAGAVVHNRQETLASKGATIPDPTTLSWRHDDIMGLADE